MHHAKRDGTNKGRKMIFETNRMLWVRGMGTKDLYNIGIRCFTKPEKKKTNPRDPQNTKLQRPQKTNEVNQRITGREGENLGGVRVACDYRPLPRQSNWGIPFRHDLREARPPLLPRSGRLSL